MIQSSSNRLNSTGNQKRFLMAFFSINKSKIKIFFPFVIWIDKKKYLEEIYFVQFVLDSFFLDIHTNKPNRRDKKIYFIRNKFLHKLLELKIFELFYILWNKWKQMKITRNYAIKATWETLLNLCIKHKFFINKLYLKKRESCNKINCKT